MGGLPIRLSPPPTGSLTLFPPTSPPQLPHTSRGGEIHEVGDRAKKPKDPCPSTKSPLCEASGTSPHLMIYGSCCAGRAVASRTFCLSNPPIDGEDVASRPPLAITRRLSLSLPS